MPSVPLKKADKQEALKALVRKQFKRQYDELTEKVTAFAQTAYDDIYGETAQQIKEALGDTADQWIPTRQRVMLQFPDGNGQLRKPMLMIPSPNHHWAEECLFAGLGAVHRQCQIALAQSVFWPANIFNDTLDLDLASAEIKAQATQLRDEVHAFGARGREFYNNAERAISPLRSSKQVDEHFPELWEFLPEQVPRTPRRQLVPTEDIQRIRFALDTGQEEL